LTDIFSNRKRSQIMSKISGKENNLEISIRRLLFSKGFRYRKNVKVLPGTPDIVLSRYKTVILVNGCFWHGHDCGRGKLPSSSHDFWSDKIRTNKARDKQNALKLKKLGWYIITIWQCEVRTTTLLASCVTSIEKKLHSRG
jgi:DNA mismatch endonuclease (patch repair protein)